MDKVCEDQIQPFIEQSYKELSEYLNTFAQKMFMKREALADKGIWTAKKRYILNVYNNEGVAYAQPKIKVTGIESIKSSTPIACRSKLKNAIDIIINSTEADMQKFIKDFREEFSKLPEGDIASPCGVNGIEKYTGTGGAVFGHKTPFHVRGALVYNNEIKKRGLHKKYQAIKEGEKIKYIYLVEPNNIKSNVISFTNSIPKEFDVNDCIDYDTQFNKRFVEPLKKILDCIGWQTEKRGSMKSFMFDEEN